MPGRDDDKHVGNPMSHLFRRRNGEADDLAGASDDIPVTPVDLVAVQSDEAMLNTLGRADVVRGGDTDAELVRVLVAWRREVDTESIGPLVDIDTAVATISAARKSASRRHSMLGWVAAAAAVLVIAFAGVGMVAKSAQPSDELWPVTKLLYSKYARSVEAAKMAKIELAEAQTALKNGNTSQARESLEKVQEQLDVIDEEQGHRELETEHRKLEQMLDGTPPGPAELDPTTTAPQTTSPEVSATSVPSSEPTTTTAPSPIETKPAPTSSVTTIPRPTVSVSEPATAETRSSSGAGSQGSEESSPPPPVTVSSS